MLLNLHPAQTVGGGGGGGGGGSGLGKRLRANVYLMPFVIVHIMFIISGYSFYPQITLRYTLI